VNGRCESCLRDVDTIVEVEIRAVVFLVCTDCAPAVEAA